jgi:hypothetical protein
MTTSALRYDFKKKKDDGLIPPSSIPDNGSAPGFPDYSSP